LPLYFFYLFKIVRSCFKKYVNEILENCYYEEYNDNDSKNIEECRYLPIICDLLIRYYLPVYHK
jgi:hypothetical protein